MEELETGHYGGVLSHHEVAGIGMEESLNRQCLMCLVNMRPGISGVVL